MHLHDCIVFLLINSFLVPQHMLLSSHETQRRAPYLFCDFSTQQVLETLPAEIASGAERPGDVLRRRGELLS